MADELKDPIFSKQFDPTELTDFEKYMKHQQQASEAIPPSPIMDAPAGSNDGAQAQAVVDGSDTSAEALHQILVVVTEIRDTLKQILQ